LVIPGSVPSGRRADIRQVPVSTSTRFGPAFLAVALLALAPKLRAQIDPEPRRLFQGGYNQPIEGRGPLAAYGYYYHNEPGFFRTNLTLRAVVAPTWLDSELGFRSLLGPNTDLGLGLAGGGFGDSYWEVRRGQLIREESFYGHGADGSVSIYHLFNPVEGGGTPKTLAEAPLQGILRSSTHFTRFDDESRTSPIFAIPGQRLEYTLRTGLRWGGREPIITPAVAFELSGWYEGHFRTDSQVYGFGADRGINAQTHLFWARGLIAYTVPESGHRFEFNLTLGGSWNADRFTAYRLGGTLPLSAEFPLMLPGYYFQELSARRFALATFQYSIPLNLNGSWEVLGLGATGAVDYLPGLGQPGNWHSGLGGGVAHHSPSGRWHALAIYGHGFDAMRGDTRGANSVAILVQYDLGEGVPGIPGGDRFRRFVSRMNQNAWRGMERLLGR
jgi:hypothetical protein